MISKGKIALIVQLISTLVVLHSVSHFVRSEKLPTRTYTTADGLGHNNVQRIVRDSRGFLWFCTFEGLSRFDGYTFTTYGTEHGLPSQVVNDLLETRDGQYWVATDAGLCRFNPRGIPRAGTTQGAQNSAASGAMFTLYLPGEDAKSRQVTSLLQSHSGGIWCGTARGLYRLEESEGQLDFRFIELGMPTIYGESRNVTAMIEDQNGALWIGSSNSGIYRLLPDWRAENYRGFGLNFVHSLLADREGRIWAATQYLTLCRLMADPDPSRPIIARTYSIKDGLPFDVINKLFQASDGGLWAASGLGLIRFIPTVDGKDFRFRLYGPPHGLSSQSVQALAEDSSGNLWIGMANGGAAKLARSGITAYGEADGFKSSRAIFKDKAERLNVVTIPNEKEFRINRFDGEHFTAVRLKFPKPSYLGWGWDQLVLEDRAGEWWVATGDGIYRYPKVDRFDRLGSTLPKAAYSTRDGLPSNDILRLFEDSRGDIWVATANGGGLSRWERATQAFNRYTEQDGLPSLANFYPISFAEDRAGDLWIGFSIGGGLVRYRDGRFTRFAETDNIPEGGIFNLFVDSTGRLWVPTTRGGVCRIDHPEAERPTVLTYATADGLSSEDVKAVTEDRRGRIYLGTGRGIDRLDPTTGHIRHYTANEGALLGNVNAALADRDGALWFSYSTGLVRLVPEHETLPMPPPILISGIRVAGEAQLISAVGETEVMPISIDASKSELQIDFVALGFSPGEGLRYQYKLEGTDEDWRQPSDQRTVNFAQLGSGSYRFMVRAINADGVISETPASFQFKILPHIWQRWWFLSLAVLLIGVTIYALYRYRVGRLLEIERIRTRIAADLHDDIGSNLSQIAIWSDVAQRQLAEAGGVHQTLAVGSMPSPLERIAATARETASAMSDIVWAINPRRDYLSDLVSRMRRLAGEALDSRDIAWRLDAPPVNLSVNAETRRELFLIFKEAINNIARHARCTEVEILLSIDGNRLLLRIHDNGCGFDARTETEGHGLSSLRERAEDLGGALDIESSPGRGTTVQLKTVLGQSRWLR